MTRLGDLQREFAGAALDTAAEVPGSLSRKAGGAPTRRFGVHRNNVYASLIDVLAGRFPVVLRLVGEEFFRAMARAYIEREPPGSAVLIHYGVGFPGFVASFPPAAAVPYIADMAALEWAWHEAYHAPDLAPLPLTELEGANARAEATTLRLQPSLGIVRSAYPIVSIYERNRHAGEVQPIRLEGGEDALVVRPRLEVELHVLTEGGASFVSALKQEKNLAEAAPIAFEETPEFDLTANLALLMQSGAITGFRVAARDPSS